MAEEVEPPRPMLIAKITCAIDKTSLDVPVDPDFKDLPVGSQISALTDVAKQHGFEVIRHPNGTRSFVCPECLKSAKPALQPFEAFPKCGKCGTAKPHVAWCAGCPRRAGEHLHHECRKCKFVWTTHVKDKYNGKSEPLPKNPVRRPRKHRPKVD